MKKLFVCVLTVFLVFSLCACGNWKDNAVDGWDNLANSLSKSQITKDDDLIGERTLSDDDYYTGSYTAECENTDGRDVVFGGASVYEKKLKVTAKVETTSGKATFRIRLGSEVEEHTTDEEGNLELDLELESGNIYVMIDYSEFTGNVEMACKYSDEKSLEIKTR